MAASPGASRVPNSLLDLLTTNVVAHLTTIAGDGSLVSHIVWIDFDGEHLLTSSPNGSHKGRNVRERPQVAVSVVDPTNPWRSLSFSGRVTSIVDDSGLKFINRMSMRYRGQRHPRTSPGEIFVITIDRIRARE